MEGAASSIGSNDYLDELTKHEDHIKVFDI